MSVWTDLLPAEVKIRTVAGISTRVLRLGPEGAPPVILMHGRGGHLETFVRNASALARDDRSVIAFDLLGHGLTHQAGRNYDIGELLDHARAVIDEYAPAQFDLIGQSLGGWLAVLLARERAPRGLVLIEPAGFQSPEVRFADPRVRAAADAGGQAFEDASEANVELRFRQLLHEAALIDPEMVTLRTALYRLPGAGAVHRAVRNADNTQWLLSPTALAEIGVPPLIIRGEFAHLPVELLSDVAARAGGRVETIPLSKQWPHYENPDAVNDLIGTYLEERTR